MVDVSPEKTEIALSNEEEDLFVKEEDISEAFEIVQRAWMEYENCDIKMPYEEAIKTLKKIEKSIIAHGMFSPNESLKELHTENLKYLLVPFFIADIFGRIMENRRVNLGLQKAYYDEFIKLVNHYELVTKEQRKQWKSIYDDMEYQPSREEKIQSFKDKKELDEKIKNLAKIKDEDSQREVLLLNIKTKIMKAIEDIRMTNMAIQFEEHRKKLEEQKKLDPNFKEDVKPAKPMKVWHVPKHTHPEQSGLMSSAHVGGCSRCDPMHKYKHIKDLKEGVFKPGWGQPTMTLDEFADIAIKDMEKQQEAQKRAEAQAKEEADKDPDKDENADIQTLKDREWDNWKDEHEKGAGNKMR